MVFNIGSLIRVGNCEVFCFEVICVWLKHKTFCEFCHSYVALVVLMQVFLGYVHSSRRSICFVLQVICFHLWWVNYLLCLVMVEFLPRF
jgi:hypothetical protein